MPAVGLVGVSNCKQRGIGSCWLGQVHSEDVHSIHWLYLLFFNRPYHPLTFTGLLCGGVPGSQEIPEVGIGLLERPGL
jgi:hypothetical protein